MNIVACSPFNTTDTWAYYHAVYLPSHTYSFPSGSLSVSQCLKLQCQIKQSVLPKFNQNITNAIVYGSAEYILIEMHNLVTEQGLSQFHSLLLSLHSTGVAHKLALIVISWVQFLACTSCSIFNDVSTPLPHLILMVWIPAVCEFLSNLSTSIG